MRTIEKKAGPACLREAAGEWDSLPGNCHIETRTQMLAEQHGLCAYCERKYKGCFMEHLFPRSRFPTKTFDYENIVISCLSLDSCGKFKDGKSVAQGFSFDEALFVSPVGGETANLFNYDIEGSISPGSKNLEGPEFEKAVFMIGYLNLNAPALQERRKQHANILLAYLADVLTGMNSLDPQIQFTELHQGSFPQPFISLSKSILKIP